MLASPTRLSDFPRLCLLSFLFTSPSRVLPPRSKAILSAEIPVCVPAACGAAGVICSEVSNGVSEMETGRAQLKEKRKSEGESLGDCVVSNQQLLRDFI